MANETDQGFQSESTSLDQEVAIPKTQTLMERARDEAVVNAARNGYGADVQAYLRDISAWH